VAVRPKTRCIRDREGGSHAAARTLDWLAVAAALRAPPLARTAAYEDLAHQVVVVPAMRNAAGVTRDDAGFPTAPRDSAPRWSITRPAHTVVARHTPSRCSRDRRTDLRAALARMSTLSIGAAGHADAFPALMHRVARAANSTTRRVQRVRCTVSLHRAQEPAARVDGAREFEGFRAAHLAHDDAIRAHRQHEAAVSDPPVVPCYFGFLTVTVTVSVTSGPVAVEAVSANRSVAALEGAVNVGWSL
jgi:hypothetical protein